MSTSSSELEAIEILLEDGTGGIGAVTGSGAGALAMTTVPPGDIIISGAGPDGFMPTVIDVISALISARISSARDTWAVLEVLVAGIKELTAE